MINNKILIVDDSNVIKKLMTLHLSKNGYEVFTSSSTLEAASILLKENIVLVITSINMPTFSGLDFLIWLKKHKPGVKIIVMTAFSNDETKELIIKNMGISYFEKGSDYANLDKMISKVISSSQFEVEIKEINLFEFFYMIILSKKTKLVSILEKSKNKRGLVYFKEGKIIHAKFNEFEGEKALFEIIKIKDGDFIEHDWVEPEKTTINISFDFLLMNMAQNANNVDKSDGNTTLYNSNIKKEVAIFEDNLEITKILKASLKEKDFIITRIYSSDDFMDTIRAKNFGLIICNIRMIELKGLDFLLWLKNNQNNTRVLILSDSISQEAKS
ncbi:MAG: response regulator, partial [Candidatus Sericytochromatia bacterium]|nr:response regulator [Candidatus Sericytochromatia bacterium]